MRITLIPQRRDDDLVLQKSGDTLTVSGDALDFSALAEGSVLPETAIDNPFVVGDVKRLNGVIHVSLVLPRRGPRGVFTEDGELCPHTVINSPADGAVALPDDPDREIANAD